MSFVPTITSTSTFPLPDVSSSSSPAPSPSFLSSSSSSCPFVSCCLASALAVLPTRSLHGHLLLPRRLLSLRDSGTSYCSSVFLRNTSSSFSLSPSSSPPFFSRLSQPSVENKKKKIKEEKALLPRSPEHPHKPPAPFLSSLFPACPPPLVLSSPHPSCSSPALLAYAPPLPPHVSRGASRPRTCSRKEGRLPVHCYPAQGKRGPGQTSRCLNHLESKLLSCLSRSFVSADQSGKNVRAVSTASRTTERADCAREAGKKMDDKKRVSIFQDVEEAPPDPILGLQIAFNADPSPQKVNLGIGAYRTEEGEPYVFKCVREVEREMVADQSLSKEYLPIDGLKELKKGEMFFGPFFQHSPSLSCILVTPNQSAMCLGLDPAKLLLARLQPCQELLFGEASEAIASNRICSVQVLSGTGGLRVAAEFIHTFLSSGLSNTVYMSEPTWPNHPNIFKKAGMDVRTYPYWSPSTCEVDFEAMKKCLQNAPPHSFLLLHACAHNPTGVDLAEPQWREVLDLCRERSLTPVLDIAYQGYATGDLVRDSFSTRLFCNQGDLEFFVSQSFAKNMGLYGERIGMLHVVCATEERAKVVLSQLKKVIRPMYSSPPLHGARIASRILSDPALKSSWLAELKDMASRIQRVREALRKGLESKGTPGQWKHITDQIGMFSYTGLTREQSERMTRHWHIYMMQNGRISLAGLNQKNIPYVVDAIDEVVRTLPAK